MLNRNGEFEENNIHFDKDGQLVCDHDYHRQSRKFVARDSTRSGAKNEFKVTGELRQSNSTDSTLLIVKVIKWLFILSFGFPILMMILISLIIGYFEYVGAFDADDTFIEAEIDNKVTADTGSDRDESLWFEDQTEFIRDNTNEILNTHEHMNDYVEDDTHINPDSIFKNGSVPNYVDADLFEGNIELVFTDYAELINPFISIDLESLQSINDTYVSCIATYKDIEFPLVAHRVYDDIEYSGYESLSFGSNAVINFPTFMEHNTNEYHYELYNFYTFQLVNDLISDMENTITLLACKDGHTMDIDDINLSVNAEVIGYSEYDTMLNVDINIEDGYQLYCGKDIPYADSCNILYNYYLDWCDLVAEYGFYDYIFLNLKVNDVSGHILYPSMDFSDLEDRIEWINENLND